MQETASQVAGVWAVTRRGHLSRECSQPSCRGYCSQTLYRFPHLPASSSSLLWDAVGNGREGAREGECDADPPPTPEAFNFLSQGDCRTSLLHGRPHDLRHYLTLSLAPPPPHPQPTHPRLDSGRKDGPWLAGWLAGAGRAGRGDDDPG
ncbi:hypothetical protein E2C01_072497 [Portunus trituberculatus]|uniref:Uncharacterized protein n=1 Tax=Portunus trituberculatus TaxID=210409 RepID=A0A5B7IBH4_PORTR|nr:hypothetical protein [Portunus trituberculatus]